MLVRTLDLPRRRHYTGFGEVQPFFAGVLDVEGEAIVVSQFTLYANTQKGRRPSFIEAALPEIAEPLVDRFVELLRGHDVPTQTGQFGAHMEVEIHNDGPVTIWLEK